MPTTRPALREELARKTCLACGYHGRELQGERGRLTFSCPSCGDDLYARPPRSYAEMEGITPTPPDAHEVGSYIEANLLPITLRARSIDHRRLERRLSILERTVAVALALLVVSIITTGALAAIL